MLDGTSILQGVAGKAVARMIQRFAPGAARDVVRSLGSLSWLLPSDESDPQRPLVATPQAVYVTGNLSAALRRAGATAAAAAREAFLPLAGAALSWI